LDCGAGHGCGLAEESGSGRLLGWFCASDLVKGRAKPRPGQSGYLDMNTQIEFCCNEIGRASLAEALDDFVADEIVVPKGGHQERVSHCGTGTIAEILQAVGLSTRSTPGRP
jgi:hypothetical protein